MGADPLAATRLNGFLPIQLAVVPILVGPLQVLLAILPAILVGLGSAVLALFKPATFKLALKLLWRMKVSVIVVVALVIGGFAALRASFRKPGGEIGEAEAAMHEWAMFRGRLARTGVVPGSPSPIEGGINWAFSSDAKTFYSSPSIVGNRLYITSAEVGVFSNRGAIYCLDADTGAPVWKSVPEGFRATFSSPAVSGKYLVTGEGLHQTRDARISCLDVTRQGALLWSYRTKSHVESSPIIHKDRVYIGAGDDGYYCFQLEPGERGEPILVWHLAPEKYPDAESSPIAYQGRIYFGLGLEGQAVVCVDAENGNEIWRLPTPFPVFGPPTIAGDKLFVGMGHGNFVESAEQLRERRGESHPPASSGEASETTTANDWPLEGEVWCIDPATGKVEWRFKTDRTVLGAIAAGEGGLVFGSRGGTVYRVGFDGQEMARWNAQAPLLASVAVTPTHVYSLSEKGRLCALEASNLRPVFATLLASGGSYLSSPAIARGHIYVGSPEHGLFCLGSPAGEVASTIWAGALGGAGAGGHIDRSYLPEEGTLIWSWPVIDPAARAAPSRITAPAAAVTTRLFVPVASAVRRGVACLNATNDHQPAAPEEEWFAHATNPVTLSPVASEKYCAFVDGSEGSENRRLHFIDASTGVSLWTSEVASDASGMTLLRADALLVQDEAGHLTSFDFVGQRRWRRSLQGTSNEAVPPLVVGTPATSESLLIVTTASSNGLMALDELGGKTLWHIPLAEAPRSGPVIHGQVVLFPTRTGIAGHRLTDGKRLWHAAIGEVNAPLGLGRGFVAAVNAAGDLIVIDPANGAVQTRQSGVTSQIPPLVADDVLLYATSGQLMVLDVKKQTSRRWMKTADLGTVTSPMIMANSFVYFGTEGYGFVCVGRVSE